MDKLPLGQVMCLCWSLSPFLRVCPSATPHMEHTCLVKEAAPLEALAVFMTSVAPLKGPDHLSTLTGCIVKKFIFQNWRMKEGEEGLHPSTAFQGRSTQIPTVYPLTKATLGGWG